MQLTPRIYHWFIRPAWFSNRYIHRNLKANFDFNHRRVLDFGCGIGSNSPIFHADDYLGVDCDPKRVQYAKRLYPDYCFLVLQGHNLPLPDKTVDYILIVSVLHHIPLEESKYYLKEFRRALKPHGKIIIIEPSFHEKSCLCNMFMRIFDRGNHIQSAEGYMSSFNNFNFQTEVLGRYRQLFFYNKVFFCATQNNNF